MKVYIETLDHRSLDKIYLICKVSKAKHKKLKDFARGRNYWFDGLTGSNWYRGGSYPFDSGFINPSKTKENNVQGACTKQGDVLLLQKVTTEKPTKITEYQQLKF